MYYAPLRLVAYQPKEKTIMNNPSNQTFEEWSNENAMEDPRTQEEMWKHWFEELLEDTFTEEGIEKFWNILQNRLELLKGYADAHSAIQEALGEMDKGDAPYVISAFVEALELSLDEFWEGGIVSKEIFNEAKK